MFDLSGLMGQIRQHRDDFAAWKTSVLARLDVSISSRAPESTALSTANWSNGRALLLDNLNATVASRASSAEVASILSALNGIPLSKSAHVRSAGTNQTFDAQEALLGATYDPTKCVVTVGSPRQSNGALFNGYRVAWGWSDNYDRIFWAAVDATGNFVAVPTTRFVDVTVVEFA